MLIKQCSLALGIILMSGCVSISPSDNEKLRDLRTLGISEQAVVKKNAGTAGALNLLPGIGNFYLASGTSEGSQWTYGFLNLLTWPLSIIWGIPQASADATTINKLETVYYYNYTAEGKQQLEARRAVVMGNSSSAPSKIEQNQPVSGGF